MDAASTLARTRAERGLTQTRLARRAGTSQATISAYEAGRKVPSLSTLDRLLNAMGSRLVVAPAIGAESMRPERLIATERELMDVLALAAELPVEHSAKLVYPRLPKRP